MKTSTEEFEKWFNTELFGNSKLEPISKRDWYISTTAWAKASELTRKRVVEEVLEILDFGVGRRSYADMAREIKKLATGGEE